jgi:hypothetical protein
MDKNSHLNNKRERSESQNSEENLTKEEQEKRMKLPKKSDFRMHAHCNPLAEMTIP